MNRPQSRDNFNRISQAKIEKLHRKVKNTKEYMELEDDDIKSFINNGWRVRSKKIHVLPS